jgi:hypothetical protein
MATDYLLFVHGVKTRREVEFRNLASTLFKNIQRSVPDQSRVLKPVYFFWGDLNQSPQNALLKGFEASSTWRDFWFRDFRTQQVLEFVGDGALYLSRHIGSELVKKLRAKMLEEFKDVQPGDRLHLVTHSWGTVILFDILFAARWEDEKLDQDVRNSVQRIRNLLFGIPLDPETDIPAANVYQGLPVASIHTLGSPIALFSLISVTGESTHDLTPKLKDLLENLHTAKQKALPWRNYAHPGDPLAYPLEGVMPLLLKESTALVQIQDVITEKGNLLTRPFNQTLAPLLSGGDAHNSYWKNGTVAKTIGEVIRLAV